MYYTYILICNDNSYYVGSTKNPIQRLQDHNSGKGANYPFKRKPCFLVWQQKFASKTAALKRELEIKKFSRRKKENLIFYPGSIWQHYKGEQYIILKQIDDLLVYSQIEKWKKYFPQRKEKGNQLEICLRCQNQWLDIIEVGSKKILRFSLIEAL